MIAFASTLKHLRDIAASYADGFGENTPVVTPIKPGTAIEVGTQLDIDATLEIVWVDAAGVIVGTEADDYRPKAGERLVVVVT